MRNDDENQQPFTAFSVHGFAKSLNVSDPTVWRMIRSGELIARKVRGRTLLFQEDVSAWRASLPRAHAEAA